MTWWGVNDRHSCDAELVNGPRFTRRCTRKEQLALQKTTTRPLFILLSKLWTCTIFLDLFTVFSRPERVKKRGTKWSCMFPSNSRASIPLQNAPGLVHRCTCVTLIYNTSAPARNYWLHQWYKAYSSQGIEWLGVRSGNFISKKKFGGGSFYILLLSGVSIFFKKIKAIVNRSFMNNR